MKSWMQRLRMSHLSSYAGNDGDLGDPSSYYGASSGYQMKVLDCYLNYATCTDQLLTITYPYFLQCWAVRKVGGDGSMTLINGIRTMNFIIVQNQQQLVLHIDAIQELSITASSNPLCVNYKCSHVTVNLNGSGLVLHGCSLYCSMSIYLLLQ